MGKSFTVSTSPAGVLAEDVTNDRMPDIVTANTLDDKITLIPANSTGASPTPRDYLPGLPRRNGALWR